jgi:hypothetical protein
MDRLPVDCSEHREFDVDISYLCVSEHCPPLRLYPQHSSFITLISALPSTQATRRTRRSAISHYPVAASLAARVVASSLTLSEKTEAPLAPSLGHLSRQEVARAPLVQVVESQYGSSISDHTGAGARDNSVKRPATIPTELWIKS